MSGTGECERCHDQGGAEIKFPCFSEEQQQMLENHMAIVIRDDYRFCLYLAVSANPSLVHNINLRMV